MSEAKREIKKDVQKEILVGVDLGNRYGKIKSDTIRDEIIISWKELSEDDFYQTEKNDLIYKVIYKGKYFIVGLTGDKGINNRNKGEESVKEMSNMIKLLLLSKDMEKRDIDEGTYKIVSGTPYNDFDIFKNDYINLFKTNEDFEKINVNGNDYKIKVDKVALTKQSQCTILTLPDRKTENYLIWDWGGETLDVCYFINGIMFKGQTFDFSLNRKFRDLGYLLNKYIDIGRPKLNDATFMKNIEKLLLEGEYQGLRNIQDGEKIIKLIDIANNYFEKEITDITNEVKNEVDITETELGNLKHIHIGGGAKSLKHVIPRVKMFSNAGVAEDPEYRNVDAYYEIATKLSDSKWY